jgi:uncharacterized membrane protein (DUF2068 family)
MAGIVELFVSGAALLMAGNAFVAVVPAVLGLVSLYVAWGLWTLKTWAFWTAVVIEVLAIATNVVSLLTQPSGNLRSKLPG